MATPHIAAEPGDFASAVLMPGDPKRAERIATLLMPDARLVTDVRGMLGFTGTVDGRPLSVLGSGMGQPSITIYATELYSLFGVQRIIRVGTCGAMVSKVKVRDVIISTASHTNSSLPTMVVPGITLAAAPSFDLLRGAVDAARDVTGVNVHVGPTYSSDTFYFSQPHWIASLSKLGTLAVEMEATGLYLAAMAEGKEALTVLTASDHLLDAAEDMTAEERETSYQAMVTVAAKALIS